MIRSTIKRYTWSQVLGPTSWPHPSKPRYTTWPFVFIVILRISFLRILRCNVNPNYSCAKLPAAISRILPRAPFLFIRIFRFSLLRILRCDVNPNYSCTKPPAAIIQDMPPGMSATCLRVCVCVCGYVCMEPGCWTWVWDWMLIRSCWFWVLQRALGAEAGTWVLKLGAEAGAGC